MIIHNTEAIYVRQSVDKKDSLSIDTQIEKCKALSCDGEKVKIYSDKGFSGKNTNRPGFISLMEDVRSGYISKVIVYKLDRLSRSTLDFGILMETFKKHGVEFHSISETFDTSTPMGKAMLQIVMVFAELERSTIASRVRDNYYERGKRGLFLGGPAPFGFKNVRECGDDGKNYSNLNINIEEAKIVSEMFITYANNDKMTLSDICSKLNIEDKLSRQKNMWDTSRISKILKNPCYVKADANIYTYFKSKDFDVTDDVLRYTGEYACNSYGKREANNRTYTGKNIVSISRHNGFIEADIWLKCQYKLDGNIQISNTNSGKNSWLTGLIKCGKCGFSMSIRKYKEYRYLMCRGNDKKCKGQNITQYADVIEKYIDTEITKKLELLPEISGISQPINFIENNETAMKIAVINDKIENIVNSISLLEGDAIDILGQSLNKLSKEKSHLEDSLINAQKLKFIKNPFDRITKIKKDFTKATFDEKKLIAKTLINKIYIKDTEIEIIWKV